MQEDKVLDPFRVDNEDSLLRRISLSRDSLLGWIDHRVVSGSKRGSTQCRRSSTVGSESKYSVPQVGKYPKRRRAVRTVTYTFYISEMSRLGQRDAYVRAADPGSQSYHVISWHTVVDAFEIWLTSIFRLLSAWCVRSLSISCVSSSTVALSLNVHSIPDTHAEKIFMSVENVDSFLRRISPESRHSQTRGTSTTCGVWHEASRMVEQLISKWSTSCHTSEQHGSEKST